MKIKIPDRGVDYTSIRSGYTPIEIIPVLTVKVKYFLILLATFNDNDRLTSHVPAGFSAGFSAGFVLMFFMPRNRSY